MAATLRTDTGRVRRQNEDAAFMDEERGVFAVADGMGGHLAGEVASAMAVDAVRRMAQEHGAPGIAVLRDTVLSAHRAILERAQSSRACSGMGTTLSLLWQGGRYAYIAHVGDSRIYRMRDGQLEQITQDHSLVAEMVRGGLITPEEARVHPRRNIITRALGTQGDNTPDLLAADSLPGDLWLLCSDGLTGMVEDAEIERVLAAQPLEQAADTLLCMALDAGGRDNVTLILYRNNGRRPAQGGEGSTWNPD